MLCTPVFKTFKEWQLNKLPGNLVPKLEFGNEIVEVI